MKNPCWLLLCVLAGCQSRPQETPEQRKQDSLLIRAKVDSMLINAKRRAESGIDDSLLGVIRQNRAVLSATLDEEGTLTVYMMPGVDSPEEPAPTLRLYCRMAADYSEPVRIIYIRDSRGKVLDSGYCR